MSQRDDGLKTRIEDIPSFNKENVEEKKDYWANIQEIEKSNPDKRDPPNLTEKSKMKETLWEQVATSSEETR